MPGVVMDNASVGGTGPEPSIHEPKPGLSSSSQGAGNLETSADLRNGATHVNGISKESGELRAKSEPSTSQKPPELVHITQGFFPFSELVNRSVQQCWNDLSDLITELAEMQVSPHDQSSLSIPANGKSPGNQSSGNVHKKLRILDFAHAKRAEFIKILVLSQWSRQAADVSQLIDLQGFIRTRHQAYVGALQWIGDMKRDLVRAQVANPDLKTALEVLSKGKVVAMSDLGYKPPKPLTAKRTLKKLQKLNRIISVRLALHDKVPRAFRTYRVHDGRVTFFVPGEFELDLSVGEESKVSQFFFVDIRFLFSPSCAVPKGRVFNELDIKVNDTLRDDGLQGCFDLLHGLILTNKINILFKQATDLARGLWSDVLRVELLHRTLIVQYWALKPGSKSWLEVGIKRGCRGGSNHGIPYLGLRWMQDGQEVDNTNIEFDTENLSIESVLRSVIALHVSHILSSVYTNIGAHLLFSTGALSLRAQLSRTEPGDCQLNVQLTASRHLCATIEPMSGASILSATPSILDRSDGDRSPDKSPTDDMISRIARVRCFSAIEEIESNVRMLGFETVNPRSLKFDVRRIFPSNVMRFSLFSHRLWESSWMVAATSSMDSDNWWVVQLRPTLAAENHPTSATGAQSTSMLPSAQVISSKLLIAQQQMSYASFADLGHCLTGIVAIHANAQSLAGLHSIHFCPPLQKLQLEVGLRTPDIFLRYEASNLPPALRMASPTGLKKPYVKDTVRLAFQGVDPHQKLAIIVAYGSLSIPVKSLGALISKWDRSLVFQQKGDGFAIRLLAPAGHAIIIDLIEELQRLERVLSIIESLQRKKMELRSLSLSRITFAYGPEKDLYGSININISKPSSADVDLVSAASKTDSLFLLRLGIAFDHPNSHRRIQESLAVALNNTSTDIGLDSFFELLSLTLPLLRVLDQITVNPSRNQALKVQVTVRNSKTFHIHYPAPKFRFQLTSGQHLNRMTWILKDVSGIQDRSRQSQLVDRVQERLYNSKGDGWRGLGNGVVADVDKVSNLILELDSCFVGVQSDPDMSVPKSKADHDASSGNQQHTVTKGGFEPASRAGMPPDGGGSTAGAVSRKPEHKADVPEDVIMID